MRGRLIYFLPMFLCVTTLSVMSGMLHSYSIHAFVQFMIFTGAQFDIALRSPLTGPPKHKDVSKQDLQMDCNG